VFENLPIKYSTFKRFKGPSQKLGKASSRHEIISLEDLVCPYLFYSGVSVRIRESAVTCEQMEKVSKVIIRVGIVIIRGLSWSS